MIRVLSLLVIISLGLSSCHKPDKDIEFRYVRDVVAEASGDPTLKGKAVLFNPNKVGGKLRGAELDIYINGKKAGRLDRDNYELKIPANAEFEVPFEVKVDLKELGGLNGILGMLGARKFDIRYVGKLKLLYRGIPVKVPVDHKSEVKLRF